MLLTLAASCSPTFPIPSVCWKNCFRSKNKQLVKKSYTEILFSFSVKSIMGPTIQIKRQRTRAIALWLATKEMTFLPLSPPLEMEFACSLSIPETIFRTIHKVQPTLHYLLETCPYRNPYQTRFWGQLDVAFKGHWQLGHEVGGCGASLSAHGSLCSQVSLSCRLLVSFCCRS